MEENEVLRLWKQRPFKPFRIFTTADEVVDVMHPRLMIAGGGLITIGKPHPTEPPPSASDLILLEATDISRIEPLEAVVRS
ncbi:MAG TPA: hypothetical protein VGI40_20680 [Pirellulaceae bacterium]|jgi:hypothetical protein